MAEEKFYSALHWAKKAERFADNAKTSEEKAAEYAEIVESAAFGNIGDIKYTSRTDVPNGGAWCDGALYTKAQFPDVYQMLVDGKLQSTTVTDFDSTVSTNGSCGFFGLDTANESFKVPLLKDVYLKAGQAGEMFGAESLPNITGIRNGDTVQNEVSGAYLKGSKYSTYGTTTGSLGYFDVEFNASRSSSTYQDGAKVNPDHVVYRAYVVLYASAAEASVAQAAEFIDGLAGKANVSLDNLSAAGEEVIDNRITNIVNSKKYDIFPRTATDISGSRANWTAPSNGWLRFTYTHGNMATGEIYINGIAMVHTDWQNTWNSGNAYLTWPMKKGDKLTSSLPGYYTFWTTA